MTTMQYTEKDAERFWAEVDKSGGNDACWLWTGHKVNGYGRFKMRARAIKAHRVSWELGRGPLPLDTGVGACGTLVLHNCPGGDNPSCVNPRHLWTGTQKQNMHDCTSKNRMARGDKKPGAKLTVVDVLSIRSLYTGGEHTTRSLAKMFGVHYATIQSILVRKKWSHLPKLQEIV